MLLGGRLAENLRGLLWRAPLRKWRLRAFSSGSKRGAIRIGVPFYGYLNMDAPEKFSDLFFWQQSPLQNSDLLLVFDYPRDPLDAAKKAALDRAGIDCVALHPRATVVGDAPMFIPLKKASPSWIDIPRGMGMRADRRWSEAALYRYDHLKRYWGEFFEQSSVRIFVMWYMFDELHAIVRDALNERGGITAVYQRSHDSQPSAQMAVSTDVYFGFAASGLQSGRCPFAQVGTYVMIGYLGDHRFALVRPEAQKLRNQLMQRGAHYIIKTIEGGLGTVPFSISSKSLSCSGGIECRG